MKTTIACLLTCVCVCVDEKRLTLLFGSWLLLATQTHKHTALPIDLAAFACTTVTVL